MKPNLEKIGNRRGVTLLELVIAVSLIGVVGLSFAFLYTGAQRFWIQSVNFTVSQGEASFGLEHIKRRLLQTTAIDNPGWPPVPPAVTTTLPLVPNGTAFQFKWQPDRTTLPDGIDGRYQLAEIVMKEGELPRRVLQFKRGTGEWETIAWDIQSVTFTRTGRIIMTVEITSERASGGDTQQTRLKTIVTPRGLL